MIELKPVPAALVHERWPWVREGVAVIFKRARAHGIPEDVYADLKSGAFTLFVITAEHEEPGWVILQQKQDYDGRVLFIQEIWGKLAPYEHEVEAEIEKVARSISAKRIRWEGRKGWARRGWGQPMRTVYEREL